jgi:glutamyl-tRNA synthetase
MVTCPAPPVVRFAPSPTGFLHIGGARTALYNWLFARHHRGRFLLRIEDTDRQRSTPAAIEAIIDGMTWLELDWEGEPVMQFARMARHAEVAQDMLRRGHAYHCYASPKELNELRAKARAEGGRFESPWRDRDPADAPAGVKPVVRLKAPRAGSTVVEDLVQGTVTFDNKQLDDMVLLRSDGTPTYMHSVVVDDHDMAITHVIRGDDHLNNAPRQMQIYLAMGWDVPHFAHIPLIHGPDGAKLSKRHGALGVEAYRDMGYLPEAIRNYLMRLGWGHCNEEFIPTARAVELFDIDGVGRAAARFDKVKLDDLNGKYIAQTDDAQLVALIESRLGSLSDAARSRLLAAMPGLKTRAKTLIELAENARFYVAPRPIELDPPARKLLESGGRARLLDLQARLAAVTEWTAPSLEAAVRTMAEAEGTKLGQLAQPLRAAVTGRAVSPPVFEVLAALGREESLGRLRDAAWPAVS